MVKIDRVYSVRKANICSLQNARYKGSIFVSHGFYSLSGVVMREKQKDPLERLFYQLSVYRSTT